ncbi:MAG: YggS family pyridoxal phosphate-dependent enzyme [Buchnera aphidicola (Nurudea yanoniella)]
MLKILKNLKKIRKKITYIKNKYECSQQNIRLLAVSKFRSISEIQTAKLYKQREFGENYVQESLLKIKKLQNIKWHFIGQIQSNKAHIIAKNFSWCHTVENEKIAKILDKHCFENKKKLNVLIQVNIRNKYITSQINIKNFKILIKKILILKNLNLRGIMGMPYKHINYNDQIKSYKNIKPYFSIMKDLHSYADTISIGTSHDIKAAILSGSTLLRIGSQIFD